MAFREVFMLINQPFPILKLQQHNPHSRNPDAWPSWRIGGFFWLVFLAVKK